MLFNELLNASIRPLELRPLDKSSIFRVRTRGVWGENPGFSLINYSEHNEIHHGRRCARVNQLNKGAVLYKPPVGIVAIWMQSKLVLKGRRGTHPTMIALGDMASSALKEKRGDMVECLWTSDTRYPPKLSWSPR
jgi:hypothetical protein